jgi:outer membrane protein TolC
MAVLAAILIISGCASTGRVAPQDSVPDAATLDVGAAIRAANADAKWPDIRWWKAYNDPQLDSIDVAKADFYPNIDLLASIGGYAAMGPLFQFFKSQSGSWTTGPATSLPIFDGGRLRGQLGATSAQYDGAVDRYDQTIVGALKNISDGVIRVRSAQTQEDDAQRSVAAATTSFDLAREGFRRGLTDYVNVLLAQTQLLHAQQNLR